MQTKKEKVCQKQVGGKGWSWTGACGATARLEVPLVAAAYPAMGAQAPAGVERRRRKTPKPSRPQLKPGLRLDSLQARARVASTV